MLYTLVYIFILNASLSRITLLDTSRLFHRYPIVLFINDGTVAPMVFSNGSSLLRGTTAGCSVSTQLVEGLSLNAVL